MLVWASMVCPYLIIIVCCRGVCCESMSDSMQTMLPSSSVYTFSWIVIFDGFVNWCPKPVNNLRSELTCFGDYFLRVFTCFESLSKRTSSLFLRKRDGLFTLLSNKTGFVLVSGKHTLCCFLTSTAKSFCYLMRLFSLSPFSISAKIFFSCLSSMMLALRLIV